MIAITDKINIVITQPRELYEINFQKNLKERHDYRYAPQKLQ